MHDELCNGIEDGERPQSITELRNNPELLLQKVGFGPPTTLLIDDLDALNSVIAIKLHMLTFRHHRCY